MAGRSATKAAAARYKHSSNDKGGGAQTEAAGMAEKTAGKPKMTNPGLKDMGPSKSVVQEGKTDAGEVVTDRMAAERKDMHGRHESELASMNTRHEVERQGAKSADDHREMTDRHEKEHREMNGQHRGERRQMMDRHADDMDTSSMDKDTSEGDGGSEP